MLKHRTLLSQNGRGRASICFTAEPADMVAASSTGLSSSEREAAHAGRLRSLILVVTFLLICVFSAFGQGGPPYYTNDPGTPGHLNWEINLGYMPFFYRDQSVSHTPDLDINFGIGDRIQLTYENAWLRVQNPASRTKFGLGQSNPGVKWRFYDSAEKGLALSVFPQLFLNNPNDAVRRGITPAADAFLLPVEISKKLGPVDVDYEIGYQFVHKGPDGWLTGVVVGHDFSAKLEGDIEFYNQGTFRPSVNQPTFDVGGRYKLHSPIIMLFMAGRSFEPARINQAYFLGYFGIQFLLPPKSYKADRPESEPRGISLNKIIGAVKLCPYGSNLGSPEAPPQRRSKRSIARPA